MTIPPPDGFLEYLLWAEEHGDPDPVPESAIQSALKWLRSVGGRASWYDVPDEHVSPLLEASCDGRAWSDLDNEEWSLPPQVVSTSLSEAS